MERKNWLAILIAMIVIMMGMMSGCVDTSSQDEYTRECIEDALSPSEETYPSIEIPATPKPEKQLIDVRAEPGYGDKPTEFYVRESKKPPENNLEKEYKIKYCQIFAENTKEHLALSWELYDGNRRLTDWKGDFAVQIEIWEHIDPYADNPFQGGFKWNPICELPYGIDYPDEKFWVPYSFPDYLNQQTHIGIVKSWITLRETGKVLYCESDTVDLGSQTTISTGKTPQTTTSTGKATSTGKSSQTTTTEQKAPSYEGLNIVDEDSDEKNDEKKDNIGEKGTSSIEDRKNDEETPGLLGIVPTEDGGYEVYP